MAERRFDDIDARLINRLQLGLPICATPYAEVAAELGMSETALLARLQRLLDDGVLSRVGPMFQIERMGGRFCLAAISVPRERFDEVSAIVNAFPEVAHNYEREHRLNMWFVVAATTADATSATLERIEAATGLHVYAMPKEKEFFVNLYLPA